MKKMIFIFITLAGLNLFAATKNCEDAVSYPEISKTELQSHVKNKTAFVVDVNGSKSYAKRHIDTAVDYQATEAAFASTLPADKAALVVAYCGGPSCVAWKKAAVAACNLGYTNIKHFKPGIKGWSI